VQRAHGFEHTFIHHPHRYSHLRKHVYFIPEEGVQFDGLAAHQPGKNMIAIHPMSMLGFGMPSLPPDLSLEARDTLLLYNAMANACDDLPSDLDLASLDPLKFLNEGRLLRQKDILDYELKLKEVLTKLISFPDSTEATSPLQRVIQSLQTFDPSRPDLNIVPSTILFLDGLLPLLADLHGTNSLVSTVIMWFIFLLSTV
jgi:ATP-dependent RNA helicase DDX60